MALVELLGKEVSRKKEKVDVSSFQEEGKVLGLYFSAHWCPPCRAFTPKLAEWYNNFKKGPNGSKLEIVFVSSDRDEASFDEYYGEMPWLALPFAERDTKSELSHKFKVSGIPTLVLLDAGTGKLITSDGRSVLMEDPEGKDFPWQPKPLSELVRGKLVNNAGEEKDFDADVKGTVFGLYFSAHWCGPCRAFTPELVKTYKKVNEQGKKFEIIFCSSDRGEGDFKSYFGTMPWLALPFDDSRKKALSRHFDISGIPSLVLVEGDAKTIISKNGRGPVMEDPEGKEFPWYPKPLSELSGSTASVINEQPCLIWFTDGSEKMVKEAKDILLPLAEAYIANQKAKDEEQELYFFYASDKSDDDDDLVQSLRGFANLPKDNPLLALINIPDQCLYLGDLTQEQDRKKYVTDFLQQYHEGTLKKKPLRG